jgi:broad specificity phosphatase PhoE
MKIYFVRHGQTGGNVAHRHQTEHTPLTDVGHEQARASSRGGTFVPTDPPNY